MKQKNKQKKDLPKVECGACRNQVEIATPPTSFRRIHYRLRVYKNYKGVMCGNCGHIVTVKESQYAVA